MTPTALPDCRRKQRRMAALAAIGGQNVLFSAAHQKLYKLDDAAAYMWRCIEDDMDLHSIVNEMVAHGVDPAAAAASARSALRDLTQLGLVGRSGRPARPLDAPSHCQHIHLAGLNARIRYATARAGLAASIFQHIECAGHQPDVVFDVHEDEHRFYLFRNDRFIESCSFEELAAVLKATLLSEVLECGDYELALHTAALVSQDRALLICGRPGAGKTTLSLALENAGWAVAGDDLALLDADGSVTGVPFPIAVKAGAWKLLAQYRPELPEAPAWRRTDRKRVRYLTPHARGAASPRRVRWVVQLRRRPGDGTSLDRFGPIDALECLLKDANGRDRKLSPTGFEALASLVDGATFYRLAYSRLEDAVKILRGSL
jgi:hypothetical protein